MSFLLNIIYIHVYRSTRRRDINSRVMFIIIIVGLMTTEQFNRVIVTGYSPIPYDWRYLNPYLETVIVTGYSPIPYDDKHGDVIYDKVIVTGYSPIPYDRF